MQPFLPAGPEENKTPIVAVYEWTTPTHEGANYWLVLHADGGFRLQIESLSPRGLHERTGTYASLSSDSLEFHFGDTHGHGIAIGALEEGCLNMDFNGWMDLEGLEDGIYCPVRGPGGSR